MSDSNDRRDDAFAPPRDAGGRDRDDEALRRISMAITPDREELAAIRARLPRPAFDYDDGSEQPFAPGRGAR